MVFPDGFTGSGSSLWSDPDIRGLLKKYLLFTLRHCLCMRPEATNVYGLEVLVYEDLTTSVCDLKLLVYDTLCY